MACSSSHKGQEAKSSVAICTHQVEEEESSDNLTSASKQCKKGKSAAHTGSLVQASA